MTINPKPNLWENQDLKVDRGKNGSTHLYRVAFALTIC